jgi:hypothetical protein
MGYTSTALGTQVVQESSGAPTQAAKQPDEAMPSSRGGARAAERARTGGAKTAPRRGQRTSELRIIVASCGRFLGTVLDARGPRAKRPRSREPVFIDKRTGTARGPYNPACCVSHKREVIGSAPEWIAPLVPGHTRRSSP